MSIFFKNIQNYLLMNLSGNTYEDDSDSNSNNENESSNDHNGNLLCIKNA
jgi:hypothetical protein